MLNKTTIAKMTAIGMLAMPIMAGNCGGGGGGGNSSNPTPAPTPSPAATQSKAQTSSTWQSGTVVDTSTADGTSITVTDNTTAFAGTSYNHVNTNGLPNSNQTDGGIYNTAADQYQVFGVTTDANGADAYASQDMSGFVGNNTTIYSAAPSGTGIVTANGIDWAYMVGSNGNAPVSSQGTGGTMNIDLDNGTVDARFGQVDINGTYSGQNMNGTANLLSNSGATIATGDMSGQVGFDGTVTYGTAGTFAGDNSSGDDDTAFAGAFHN